MTKLAIDIVLLPSEEMMDKAIEINKELLKNNENKIILNKETCLPHITLCMGVIEEEKLPEIKQVLEQIAKEFSTLKLTVEKIKAKVIPTRKKVSGLEIKNTDQLKKLQKTVMQRLWKYLTYDVESEMFYNPKEIEETTFHWVVNYAKKHDDPSLFYPHISIGFGETDKFSFPIDFTASTLALTHLGNYCTSRKVLISAEL